MGESNQTTAEPCVFCAILERTEPASFVYEDDHCAAFLTLKQVRPGETVIIPKTHVDDFTDLSDEQAETILRVAQRIGRALIAGFAPDRVGYIVHGYGVAHAHFIVLPQHDPHDITSGRFATVRDGEVHFSLDHLTTPTRPELDARAAEIRGLLGRTGEP